MTELQRVELELLKTFIDVCDNLNLRYYLVCGSALGAEKYGGFIPWDDDIDVGMPRQDYEVFQKKAQEFLPEYYFLQNSQTDPEYPLIFSKLRDSRTTYIEKSAAQLKINHGVYIDVFPLDGYPKGRIKQQIFEFRKKIYKLQAMTVLTFQRSWKAKAVNKLFRFLGYHKRTQKTVSKLTNLLSSNTIENSDYICNFGNWQGKLEYAPKEQYGNGVFSAFEGIEVRIPEKIDAYLTQKYGDWRAELPVDQQEGHHYYEVCDLSNPYSIYTKD